MKEQLIKLINTYAAARVSGDQDLQEFAALRLKSFLDNVDLIDAKMEASDD